MLPCIGLWNECANLHIGDPQEANLGDGKGVVPIKGENKLRLTLLVLSLLTLSHV